MGYRARTSREVRYMLSAVYTSRDGIRQSRVLVTTEEGRYAVVMRKHLVAVGHHRYAWSRTAPAGCSYRDEFHRVISK